MFRAIEELTTEGDARGALMRPEIRQKIVEDSLTDDGSHTASWSIPC
jgi:hypothetical protein